MGQVVVHVPLEQTLPEPQALPHAPQWLLSVCLLTHAPPQAERPALQPGVQLPATPTMLPPTGAGGQALPQSPQLFGSLLVLTHAPLHAENPSLHEYAHLPATHAGAPLGTPGQATPQAPQCAGLVVVSTHSVPPQVCQVI